MRLVTILAALLMAAHIQAQTVSSRVDEFNGIEVVETSIERLTNGSEIDSYFKVARAKEYVMLYLDAAIDNGNTVFSVRKSDRLQFKLTDGTVLTLLPHKGAVSRRGRVESASLMYLLDQEAIAALTSVRVEKMRIYTSRGARNEEVKEKHAATLQNAVGMVK